MIFKALNFNIHREVDATLNFFGKSVIPVSMIKLKVVSEMKIHFSSHNHIRKEKHTVINNEKNAPLVSEEQTLVLLLCPLSNGSSVHHDDK